LIPDARSKQQINGF